MPSGLRRGFKSTWGVIIMKDGKSVELNVNPR